MNIRKLRRIKKHILEEPARVNMNTFISSKDPTVMIGRSKSELKYNTLPSGHIKRWPECKTVACIAGWENVLGGTVIKGVDRSITFSRERLGLPNERLFYEDQWPRFLVGRLMTFKPGTLEYAKVVAEAIESYIVSNGWEEYNEY